jgi:hypothetical protein
MGRTLHSSLVARLLTPTPALRADLPLKGEGYLPARCSFRSRAVSPPAAAGPPRRRRTVGGPRLRARPSAAGTVFRCHALLSQSGHFKERSPPRSEKSGSGARGHTSQISNVARFPHPAGDFCPRPFRSAFDTLCLWLLGLRHWPLRLCARPARTARSGGRGTLGRGLPGRGLRWPAPEAPSPPHQTTVATGVPAEGAGWSMRELLGGWINVGRFFGRVAPPFSPSLYGEKVASQGLAFGKPEDRLKAG